jgi:hypothetical protein
VLVLVLVLGLLPVQVLRMRVRARVFALQTWVQSNDGVHLPPKKRQKWR